MLACLADVGGLEVGARRLAARMAQCLQGALLVRHAPPEVADAFCVSRLGGEWAGTFGTLPRGLELEALVRRATPSPAGQASSRPG